MIGLKTAGVGKIGFPIQNSQNIDEKQPTHIIQPISAMISLRLADRIVCPSRVPSYRPRPFRARPRGVRGCSAVAAALGAAAAAAVPRKAVPEWEAALRLVEAVNQLQGSELAKMVLSFEEIVNVMLVFD